MITVDITDDMKARAREYQEARQEYLTGNNYTKIAEPNSWYWGKIGELAVAKIFADYNLKTNHTEVEPSARSDKGDFELTMKDGTHQVADVKTATKDFHIMLSMPQAQFERHHHKYDMYIGTQIVGNVVRVYGYLDDFDKLQLVTEGRKQPALEHRLVNLTPIEQLIERVATNE